MKKGTKREIVLVGMSGGVDSTVAAYLLQKQNFEVIGITMQIWPGKASSNESLRSGCYGPGEIHDTHDAEQTCKKLGIPHFIIDLSPEYEKTVMDNFSNEYSQGRTPNPCVLCNPIIKFGALLEKSKSLGIKYDHFATGHYARISFSEASNRFYLMKGIDPKKDQSYFLYRLDQSQLMQSIFPLGDYKKDQVKAIAQAIGFHKIAEKPESQDFMDGGGYRGLFDKSKGQTGNILDLQGRILGSHQGIYNFTIGQRKGVLDGGSSQRMYVLRIDPLANSITVGPKEYLAVDRLITGNTNWIAFEKLDGQLNGTARLRSSQKESPCTLIPLDENQVEVRFQYPQYFATPGQSIVFYREDVVVGGGIIHSAHHLYDEKQLYEQTTGL
ncbi:MAG: tRNA 2-thiouridine(34) synthase MnmA [Anaerolineaceae bacterium]